MDWAPQQVSRLWRYNLHYFDYLRQDSMGESDKFYLISEWIAQNPQPTAPGWEPFTASLRIVNWVFFFVNCKHLGVDVPERFITSLYEQTLWLEKNDERHILANHYFENLKALAFAGSFFESVDAKRWLEQSTKNLIVQLKEQTLADGGHYERSPQYHALMLENYLDLYNLARNNPQLFFIDFSKTVNDTALFGFEYLEGIVFPDGGLPLFNDSAFGVAPELVALRVYKNTLFTKTSGTDKNNLINFEPSGLYGYRTDRDMIIVDCGDIGPAYQPGHSHCDFLSYELMWGDQRVVVDAGVFEYESGKMRDYVRSTKAHNTVSVDGDEQSEIWGEFRVARRAKKLTAVTSYAAGKWSFDGSFQGFHGVRGTIKHSRHLEAKFDDKGNICTISINDTIEGGGGGGVNHLVESFLHFHPDIDVKSEGQELALELNGINIGSVTHSPHMDARIEDSAYCPEFGATLKNKCVVFSSISTLPFSSNYVLKRHI
jgi:uncharacterized heparinase superfamily protein